tara:strand:+ start:1538 stop:1714 length:177 start_codon:yes stop_codon:yes gene_type:complete
LARIAIEAFLAFFFVVAIGQIFPLFAGKFKKLNNIYYIIEKLNKFAPNLSRKTEGWAL